MNLVCLDQLTKKTLLAIVVHQEEKDKKDKEESAEYKEDLL